MLLKIILLILVLLTALPAGYVLAKLTRDELVSGRRAFKYLACISLISFFVLAFLDIKNKGEILLTLFYIFVIFAVLIYKSYDKNI